MSIFSQIRQNMKASREQEHDQAEPESWSMSQALLDKLGDRVKGVFKVFILAIETLIKTVRNLDDEESLYDLNAEDPGDWSADRIKIWVINGVNIFIGLVGGFLVQNYLSYRSLRFMAFASGVDFSQLNGRVLSSPITILMDIVFFIAFYLGLAAVFTFVYYVFCFLFSDLLDSKEICQVGYMFGVMCAVIASLIGVILPFNIFM